MISETRQRFGRTETRVLSVPGDGTPIVLLHGYGDTADTWRRVLSRFEAAGRQAFAPDLPGFGYADARVDGPLLPQFDAFADAVVEQSRSVVLLGNSLGAGTAVRAAARHPHAVKALVTLADPLNTSHWLARLIRGRPIPERFWASVAQVPIPSSVLRGATRLAAPRVLYGSGVAVDPKVIAQWTDSLTSAADIAALGRYAFQYGHETRAGHHGIQVTCPTLIVHGARDRIVPVAASRLLHQQIPGSDFVVLPHSGHCPQLDNPSEVVRLTLRLLHEAPS